MKHEESILQRQCVAWFRAQYPQYAMLLTHVPNEGNGNRVSGAIRKAEGVVRGVPDLMLFLPSQGTGMSTCGIQYIVPWNGMGVEVKAGKGRQSPEQKEYQKMLEAAGYKYVIIRSLEDFQCQVEEYISASSKYMRSSVTDAYKEIEKARRGRELAKFNKMIGKK